MESWRSVTTGVSTTFQFSYRTGASPDPLLLLRGLERLAGEIDTLTKEAMSA